jgi:putative FmdB family regulatory protein
MPTYEYKCVDCGHLFEEFHGITSDPIKNCPSCNGVVRRLISAGNGLIFKGSGFYITDYKNKKNRTTTVNKTKKKTAA